MQIIDLVTPDYSNYLSEQERAEIDHEISLMETREAAGIEALKVVQQHRKWISDESLNAIAFYLQIPPAQLEGVATFYNLIYRQPVGQNVIHICDSIGCHLTGYEQVLAAIKAHLNIEYGQTTEDGLFTLLSNACLGACDRAPTMLIGKAQYFNLTPESAIDIINTIQAQDNSGKGGDL